MVPVRYGFNNDNLKQQRGKFGLEVAVCNEFCATVIKQYELVITFMIERYK